jgi:DNA polymerase-3 subunit epsilon
MNQTENIICFLDIETINLNVYEGDNEIIEFGYILTDLNGNLIEENSFLIKNTINLPNEHITGLTNEILAKDGLNQEEAYEKIKSIIKKAKYIVAHSGNAFDFEIIRLKAKFHISENRILIDTCKDIPLKNDNDSQKLKYKCFDYGIVQNNSGLHRALYDVKLTKALLFAYGFQNTLDYMNKPKMRIVALIAINQKNEAKQLGFQWNQQYKEWSKVIFVEDYEAFDKKCPFNTTNHCVSLKH